MEKDLKSKPKKRKLTYEKRRELSAFLFVVPFILGFLIFFLYPLIRTIDLSFKKEDSINDTFKNIGVNNYKMLFTKFNIEVNGNDYPFTRVIWDSIKMVLIELPFITIFALLIAIILNQKFKGRGLARTIFLLPIIFGSGIIAKITQMNNVGSYYNSVIEVQSGYQNLGMAHLFNSKIIPTNLVTGLNNFVSRVFAVISFSGVQILIFLSALQSVSPTLYEVAKIEGASNYQSFWKITLPQIMPVMITTVVYTFVEILYRSPMTMIIAKVKGDPVEGGIGMASAISVIFLVLTMLLLGIIIVILKGLENHGKKEKKVKRKKN